LQKSYCSRKIGKKVFCGIRIFPDVIIGKVFCKNCTIAEKFAKIGKKFLKESDFQERARGILQKSDWIIAKIMIVNAKSNFCKKKFANMFAMPASTSPWGRGF
jgi:hypothetical protein